MVAAAAIIASTALPPSLNISAALCEASAWGTVAIPFRNPSPPLPEEFIMRNQHLLIGLLAWSLCAGAQAANSVADRLAAQNALFDEQYEADLKAHPERATAFGDYRYNDQLDDSSLAGVNAQHAVDQSFLKRLNAISTTGFPEQDAL